MSPIQEVFRELAQFPRDLWENWPVVAYLVGGFVLFGLLAN